MVKIRRYSSEAASTIGLLLMLSSLVFVFKPFSYRLGDCGALVICATIGSSLGRMRREVRSYEPTLRKLRALCDRTGVRFGLRNWLFRGLYLFMLPSLFLSITFLVVDMVILPSHMLLRFVADAFQFPIIVGMGVFMMRDRSIGSTLSKIESVAYSGGLATSPPKTAKLILLLIPRRHRENLIGDLEEEYTTILLPEYGVRKARTWYWWQVTISVGPLLWAQIKRGAAAAWLWKRVR